MLFISPSAVVKIFYREVCRPYLAFFIKGKESNIFGTHCFRRKENHYMSWLGGEHQVAMLQRIPPRHPRSTLLPELWSIHWDLLKDVNKWAEA